MFGCVAAGAILAVGAVPVEQGSMLQTKRPSGEALRTISPTSVSALLQEGQSAADIAAQVVALHAGNTTDWDQFLLDFGGGIKSSLQEGHNSDQTLANALSFSQGDCETNLETAQTDLDARWASFESQKNDHTACRSGEAVAISSAGSSCDAYDAWLVAKSAGSNCLAPMARDTAVAILEARRLELQGWISTATNLKVGCDDNSGAAENKTAECALEQKGLEDNYCFWHYMKVTQHENYETCRSDIDDDFSANINDIKKRVAYRKAYWEEISMILCILQELIDYIQEDHDGQNAPNYTVVTAFCEGNVTDVDNSWLDIDYPSALPLTDIELPTLVAPGDAEWNDAHLDGREATTDGCPDLS